MTTAIARIKDLMDCEESSWLNMDICFCYKIAGTPTVMQ
jgi:hypothetical protein